MSLAINTQKVVGVLLTDGRWYGVEPGTFTTDAYEFFEGDFYKSGSYSATPPLWANPPCSTGFEFKCTGCIPTVLHTATDFTGIVSGPMTAIVAVKY